MLMVGERRRSTQIRFPVRNMHKGVIRIYIYIEKSLCRENTLPELFMKTQQVALLAIILGEI